MSLFDKGINDALQGLLPDLAQEALDPQGASEAQDEQEQEDPLETILASATTPDLKAWLNSPFWVATGLILREQIKANVVDIVTKRQAKGIDGLYYTSPEAMRGGIVAMTNMFQTIPIVLQQTLALIKEQRKEKTDG
jgi:hypothetical protein